MGSPKHTIAAPLLCDLAEALVERPLYNLCIGGKRDILLLTTEKKHKRKGFRLKGTPQFRIHHWRNGEMQETDLAPSASTFYFVAAVGENYLCVVARCDPDEHNACLFDTNGRFLRSWHIGDGIEDVQTSPNGQIWTSYFDEGVFSGGTEATSGQGLTCFDTQGNRQFGFMDDIARHTSGLDMICDCYALNVASNRDTWLCYYTTFPLVHLRDSKVKSVFQPSPEMVGTGAFAVCDQRRLFVGGYSNKQQIFWRDEASGHQVEVEVVDENGDAIIWNKAHGRGADLFLCNEAQVRILSLNDISF